MTKAEINKIQGDSYTLGQRAGSERLRKDIQALLAEVLGKNLVVNKSSKQVTVGNEAYREAFFAVHALLEKETK